MSNHVTAPLNVLVVEDDPDTAQSIADLLALWGHDVRVCGTGPDALREAEAAMPDVVLLDIGLPGTSGWEVARQIRDAARGDRPVVVAVSGYGAAADRLRSADAGAHLHLVKPGDPAELGRFLTGVRDRPTPVSACAWCGRVYADGAWRNAAARDAAVTRGICPPCSDVTFRECREGVGEQTLVNATG